MPRFTEFLGGDSPRFSDKKDPSLGTSPEATSHADLKRQNVGLRPDVPSGLLVLDIHFVLKLLPYHQPRILLDFDPLAFPDTMNNDNDSKLDKGSSESLDSSTGAPELPSEQKSQPPPDAPEGGRAAYLSLLGGSLGVFISFGWVNCIALFQAYYQSNQLSNYVRFSLSFPARHTQANGNSRPPKFRGLLQLSVSLMSLLH